MLKRTMFAALCLGAALSLIGCGSAMPDIKGKTVAQASSSLANAGFVVGKITYDGKTDGAVGAVTRQTPEAGAVAKAGSFVLLTVSGHPPLVAPDLSGLDESQATIALLASGLRVGDVTGSYDATILAGAVVSQTPAAGMDAPRGSEVNVVLSKGQHPGDVSGASGDTDNGQVKEMFGRLEPGPFVEGNTYSMTVVELVGPENQLREAGTHRNLWNIADTKFKIAYLDETTGLPSEDTPDYSKFMRFVWMEDSYVTVRYVVERDAFGKEFWRVISVYSDSSAR